mmetsp:Transcript_23913/g.26419  ORF Transcript_23913/g.26419 Transcript_23913/m.26419 type:complete len:161 (-) Transcript_23913:286-768(-)
MGLSRKENIAPSLLVKAYIVVHEEQRETRNQKHINLLTKINDAISLAPEICESQRGFLDWAFQTKQKDYDAIVSFRQVAEHYYFDPKQKNSAGRVGEEMQQFMKKFDVTDSFYPRSHIEIMVEKQKAEKRKELQRMWESERKLNTTSKHGMQSTRSYFTI